MQLIVLVKNCGKVQREVWWYWQTFKEPAFNVIGRSDKMISVR